MFFRLYKYKIKDIIHTKDLIFWLIVFPLALGTLFYFGFGSLMNGNEDKMEPIPVAVVTVKDNNTFKDVLDKLSENNDDQLFISTYTDESDAKSMLLDKTVDGILYIDDTPSIAVMDDGLNQTIMQAFLNQYLTQADMIKNIALNHPEKLEASIKNMSDSISYNHEISLTNGKYDTYVQYFYALIAMTCMYASLLGIRCIADMQADQSPLGLRRECGATSKLIVILSDFAACVTVQFGCLMLLFVYVIFILKIDMGNRYPLIFLTGLVGSIIGIAIGIFTGAIVKGDIKKKTSVVMAISMVCSFLSGLIVGTMKDIVEHNIPFINRINPAALITDCLYSLNMYNTYTRFITDIAIMLIIATILCLVGYLFLRRNKYADL